jgi:hypothetical protein
MRFRRVFVVVTLAILLALAAAVFIAFSDFGSEPVVNGMPLRRYIVYTNSEQALARIGSDAVPWLIKGLDAESLAVYRFKVRLWRFLPAQWQQKWSDRLPIHPRNLRLKCVMALEEFGPEAAAAAPRLIEFARSESNSFPQAAAFNGLAAMAGNSREASAFLIDMLRNGDGPLKRKIAGDFFKANFTPAEAVPLLIARLQNYVPPDEHSPMPFNEMLALSASGPAAASAAPHLVKYLNSGGADDAVLALRATGPAAIVALPRLLEILADGSEWTRRLKPGVYAIMARLGTNGMGALPALTNGLSDANPVVALAAAGIANITHDVEFAVPRLIEELERGRSAADGERLNFYWPNLSLRLNHRQLSAMLLGELGPRATNALPNLERALDNREIWLPIFAAKAIWKISSDATSVLPWLTKALKDSNQTGQMLTLNVLGEMGPAAEPAVPAIREVMQSDLRVRRYGYVALQSIHSTNK